VKLRLGDLTFDADARQLLRSGAEIHLSPKAFDLLKILVEHRPRVLSNNELHEHLWPSTFVSETNLARLVAELRGALGDVARQLRFICTAHRFGYAFCAEGAGVTRASPSVRSVRLCRTDDDGPSEGDTPPLSPLYPLCPLVFFWNLLQLFNVCVSSHLLQECR
jgi:DNA-binding winged helix-turn-helix (wHTH) protein